VVVVVVLDTLTTQAKLVGLVLLFLDTLPAEQLRLGQV
jgi:hypothetical protein